MAPPGENSGEYAASIDTIRAAAERIKPHVHLTPVLTSSCIDQICGRNLFFKCETLQKGGAFKFRGACNSVLSLQEHDASKGVVTHSSGNHAAAVALAASLRGIRSYIVMPQNAPTCKVDATQTYGGAVGSKGKLATGEIFRCENTMQAREALCKEVQERTGATFIPPYNYGPVISGQGTVALELLNQVSNLSAIVVPVSGGGLLSGVALAAKALEPGLKVIAAEPCGSNDAADVAQSKQAGHLVECRKPMTIADGLQAHLGNLTWPIVRDLVDDVIVVRDEDIVGAMRLIMERMKVVVEPSGAAALAAIIRDAAAEKSLLAPGSRIAVILSGGNVDFAAKGFWDNWKPAQ